MSVLTLAGKAINWSRPPKATDRVMWSARDAYGRKVTGSLYAIAHLDRLNSLAIKRFNSAVVVIQPPFNTTVAASAGTHDYDMCFDVHIPGVDWLTQQAFFRANGAGAYYRRPPTFSAHIHYFTLPPVGGDVSQRYDRAGFKVGKYVDGGWSLYNRMVGSSQISDYYLHRTALAGHGVDPTWFPASIDATLFNLSAYINDQRKKAEPKKPKAPKRLRLAMVNIPAKVGKSNVEACWRKAANNGVVFGVNESFHKWQRDLYARLMTQRSKPMGQYGLRTTPNPVFWRKDIFKFKSGKVHRIHPKNTTAPNASEWPGFYDARFITEVVLQYRVGGKEVAILNGHFAAEVKVVNQKWLRESKAASFDLMRALIRKHHSAGRIVVFMGDTNTRGLISTPRGFRWHEGEGIDKVGSNRPGDASFFPAPTDHKRGVRAVLSI